MKKLTPETFAFLLERAGLEPPESDMERLKPVIAKYIESLEVLHSINLTGVPAMSIPCGFSNTGLPVGLQLVGKPFAETTVLRVGYTYQQAAGWHQKHPPI